MRLFSRRLFFTGLIVLGFAVVIVTPAASLGGAVTNSSQTDSVQPEEPITNWELAKVAAEPPETASAKQLSILPPPAEQNPCLHCHIAGEIVTEWSPISRWLIFGAMGFTFIFGLSRNFMVWRNRELWHHRWMYRLSSITAFFFILQAVSGVILLLPYPSTSEIIAQIMAIIQAIHWGSGIMLFISALIFSFAGAMLPWVQRPFWAMIFITGISAGTLAIANLSFAYLYADWHLPPAQGRLFAFHMLLIPIAIAGLMGIYFIVQRKRGEIS